MECILCLIKTEAPIAIDHDANSEIRILLKKYFDSCVPKDANQEFICQNCWSYVKTFHDFCIRIEDIQKSKTIEKKQLNNGIWDSKSVELEDIEEKQHSVDIKAEDLPIITDFRDFSEDSECESVSQESVGSDFPAPKPQYERKIKAKNATDTKYQ